MRSFHELKTAASHNPEVAGTPPIPDQDGYFGWQVTRRLEQPPAGIQTVSPTAVTPERISRAMHGLQVFPETSSDETVVYDGANPTGPVANFRDLGRGGPPSRRTQRLHDNQGGRSPQGGGHSQGRTFRGRR